MKIILPSWTHCKQALVAFIGIVAIFIIIFATYQGGMRRSRFKKNLYDPSRLHKICKQLLRKESINWNYFYYYEDLQTKKSLVWCKTPKAASTTLTKMFLRLANNSGVKDVSNFSNSTRIHKLLRNYYPRLPSKVMKHRIKDSKSFLIVRDPFERILSAFRDKLENYERDLEYRDGYYYDHYGRFMVKSDSGNVTRKEPTWPEFVQYLLKTSVARYDEHWMPITKLCSPCTVDYTYVIKIENFAKEIRKPLSYAKIDVASLGWAHKTGTSSNRKIISSYYKNLTLADVKKLYSKYKRDFQLFGYTPFKYFKLFGDNNKANKTEAR